MTTTSTTHEPHPPTLALGRLRAIRELEVWTVYRLDTSGQFLAYVTVAPDQDAAWAAMVAADG